MNARPRSAGCMTLVALAGVWAFASAAAFGFGVYALRRLEVNGAVPLAAGGVLVLLAAGALLAFPFAPSNSGPSMRAAVALGIAALLDVGALVAAPHLSPRVPTVADALQALVDHPDLAAWGKPFASSDAGPAAGLLADGLLADGGALDATQGAVDAGAPDEPGTLYAWIDASGPHVSDIPPPAGTPGVEKKRPRHAVDSEPAHTGPAHTGPAHTGPAHNEPAHPDPPKPNGGGGEPAYSPLDPFVAKANEGGMAPALSGVTGDGDAMQLTSFLRDVVDVQLTSAACRGCGAGDVNVAHKPGQPGHVTLYVIVDADDQKRASDVAGQFARANGLPTNRVMVVTPGRASLVGRRYTLDPRGNFVKH